MRFTICDFLVAGDCGYDFEGVENGDIADDATDPWSVFDQNSAFGWIYDERGGLQDAVNNNFGSGDGG